MNMELDKDYNLDILESEQFEIFLKKEKELEIFCFNHKEGKASASAYFYYDDLDSFYLSNLFVNPNDRRNNLGTKLQIIRERLAKLLKFKVCYLMVQEDTWMVDWYKRRGYKFFQNDKLRKEHIWLKKDL